VELDMNRFPQRLFDMVLTASVITLFSWWLQKSPEYFTGSLDIVVIPHAFRLPSMSLLQEYQAQLPQKSIGTSERQAKTEMAAQPEELMEHYAKMSSVECLYEIRINNNSELSKKNLIIKIPEPVASITVTHTHGERKPYQLLSMTAKHPSVLNIGHKENVTIWAYSQIPCATRELTAKNVIAYYDTGTAAVRVAAVASPAFTKLEMNQWVAFPLMFLTIVGLLWCGHTVWRLATIHLKRWRARSPRNPGNRSAEDPPEKDSNTLHIQHEISHAGSKTHGIKIDNPM
jgi:hypothetical protein